jgi:hypothetical protein
MLLKLLDSKDKLGRKIQNYVCGGKKRRKNEQKIVDNNERANRNKTVKQSSSP